MPHDEDEDAGRRKSTQPNWCWHKGMHMYVVYECKPVNARSFH